MTYMDPTQIDELRSVLLTDRRAIVGDAAFLTAEDESMRDSQASGDARPRGEGEGDAIAVERSLNAQLSAANRRTLDEIDAALARIDAGTYGQCAGCRGDIPFERLQVRPRADTCVKCAARR